MKTDKLNRVEAMSESCQELFQEGFLRSTGTQGLGSCQWADDPL